MKLQDLLRELGLENRTDLLRLLREKPASASELRRRLKEKRGVIKPYTTIGRYIENLKNLGLLAEKEKRFHLTALGRVLLLSLEDMQSNIRLFDELACLKHPIDYLPEEFLRNIYVLKNARVLTEPYEVMLETIKTYENAESSVRILNSKIGSYEYIKLSFRRILEGIEDFTVLDVSLTENRQQMWKNAIRDLNLSIADVEKLKENFQVKNYDGLALNLLIADENTATITLPNPSSGDFLTPSFVSGNKEFIAWVQSIFQWYWDRGKKVEW